MTIPGPSEATVVEGGAPRSVTTVEDELARLDQALRDLEHSEGVAVTMIHCPSLARERRLLRELGNRARERGFVTAHLSLLEHAFDELDALVRAVLDSLWAPGGKRPQNLLELLDAFVDKHGKRSAERFQESADQTDAHGDLTALCRAYLDAPDEAPDVVRAFEAWMDGSELKSSVARRPLVGKTSQRALGELTRVLRALGYRGLALFLGQGDAIALRTDRQREKAYTVLRELVDNFDSGRGAVATRIHLTGTDKLFEGPNSVRSLEPLLMRLELPSDAEPPPPHRSWTSLVREPYEYVHRRVQSMPDRRQAALRTLIRSAQGLPPTEAVVSMSVGHERIDKRVDKLFEHVDVAGSVFSVLVGEYGSGKTHLMMHMAERALERRHPVFWLNLERMNLDLGNPQRHLGRLLERSVMPMRGRPSALDRAQLWTRSRAKMRALQAALEDIAGGDSEESVAAKRALKIVAHASDPGLALENYLGGADLVKRKTSSSYRLDAYRRLLLWIELLRRLEDTLGPVVLIDEAENLYNSGLSHAARRTALRSLAFYCGGALPGACVVVAMTPPALTELQRESRELLGEVDEQTSTLELEDPTLFRRRLRKLEPQEVPSFTRAQRMELADKVRATHRSVRGAVEFPDWEEHKKRLARQSVPPRALIRTLVDELEAVWWRG